MQFIPTFTHHTDDFVEESLFATARDIAKQTKKVLGKHPKHFSKKKPLVVSDSDH